MSYSNIIVPYLTSHELAQTQWKRQPSNDHRNQRRINEYTVCIQIVSKKKEQDSICKLHVRSKMKRLLVQVCNWPALQHHRSLAVLSPQKNKHAMEVDEQSATQAGNNAARDNKYIGEVNYRTEIHK